MWTNCSKHTLHPSVSSRVQVCNRLPKVLICVAMKRCAHGCNVFIYQSFLLCYENGLLIYIMFELIITPKAAKVLSKMPRNTAALIYEKLNELAQDPYKPNQNVKKLKGRPGYRLRVGDWRVIYTLNNNEMEIVVIKVAPRGGAYQ